MNYIKKYSYYLAKFNDLLYKCEPNFKAIHDQFT